jgi:very-short-patch-repair endonuclease
MSELADFNRGNRGQDLPRDLIVAELAAPQDGVVGLDQLRESGVSGDAVQRSVHAGRLHVVLPGVYAVGHPTLSWRGRLRAALLWGGEDAVLSHITAAGLWELLASASVKVHITLPRGARKSREWVRVHHTREMPARSEVNGFPVTSIGRTLIDLAGSLPRARLERAVEHAARMSRLDFRTLAQSRGNSGAAALRAVAAQFDPLAPQTNPGIERAFLRLIRKERLPKPRINVQVGPYAVDFLWAQQRLIVELDSLEFHRTPAVFESDRKRDIDLKRLGYTVIRITHRRLREGAGGGCPGASLLPQCLRTLMLFAGLVPGYTAPPADSTTVW